RFHDPAEAHRVRFRHRRAFDQDAVSVGKILLRGRSSAPAKGGAQTGHRAAMSYPRLVGYAHHPQAESKKFSDEIIFFIVERGTAQMTDPSGVVDRRAVLFVHECALA